MRTPLIWTRAAHHFDADRRLLPPSENVVWLPVTEREAIPLSSVQRNCIGGWIRPEAAVIWSSTTAIDFASQLWGRDHQLWQQPVHGALGPNSLTRLRHAGAAQVVSHPSTGGCEALATWVVATYSPQFLLCFGPRERGYRPGGALGPPVLCVDLYRTRDAAELQSDLEAQRRLLQGLRADVAFAAGSAVRAFVAAGGEHLSIRHVYCFGRSAATEAARAWHSRQIHLHQGSFELNAWVEAVIRHRYQLCHAEESHA